MTRLSTTVRTKVLTIACTAAVVMGGTAVGSGAEASPPEVRTNSSVPDRVDGPVRGLTLIDVATGAAVPGFDPIAPDAVIDVSSLPERLNIRADTGLDEIGSVTFDLTPLDGSRPSVDRVVENVAPYAIGGDTPDGFRTWSVPAPGDYRLRVTPFTASGAEGTAGEAHEVTLRIRRGRADDRSEEDRAGLVAGPMPLPESALRSVKDYGARGDGVTDDTAAIQAAIDDWRPDALGTRYPGAYSGTPKHVYLPAGRYRVSRPIVWGGCCVTLQGQGSSATRIVLDDASDDFGDAAAPRAVITTESGNRSFRQNIFDLGIDTGRRNPGARGIDFVGNNQSAIRNVAIRSGDGDGEAGLYLGRSWPGPMLVRGLSVDGFGKGIYVKQSQISVTFDGLVLRNQRGAGIRNTMNAVFVRRLFSDNEVPAIKSVSGVGSVTLLDSELVGGAPAACAIETASPVFLRQVEVDGYGCALEDDGERFDDLADEYASVADKRVPSASGALSLNLDVLETPTPPTFSDADSIAWRPDAYGSGAGLQSALDSGKSQVYLPYAQSILAEDGNDASGRYRFPDRTVVTIPESVDRFTGFTSVANLTIVVEGDSDEPLFIDEFGRGLKIEHRGARPVVLRHMVIAGYRAEPGAGDLFLEDVGLGPLVMVPGQNVWARQLNNETADDPKILNDGGRLWIMGMKSEKGGTIIETVNGGRTELLGAMINVASHAVDPTSAMFRSADGTRTSFAGVVQNARTGGDSFTASVEFTEEGMTERVVLKKNARHVPPFVDAD